MTDIPILVQNSDLRERIEDSKMQGTDRAREYKQVAREMESLFAYQLLKVMRETSNNISPDKKGLGYNTYMSLFDMEVSRLFAERGLGLQEAILNWLEKTPETAANNKGNTGGRK